MKKTIVAMLALTGVAFGDASLLWELDITKQGIGVSEKSVQGVSFGEISTAGITLNDGSFTTSTSSSLSIYQTGQNVLTMNDSFSIAFKATLGANASGNNWPVMLTVGEDNAYKMLVWAATPDAGWGEGDKYGMDPENWTGVSKTSGGDVATGEERAYVLTYDASGAKPVFTLYVDGVKTADRTIAEINKTSATVDSFCFGGILNANGRKYEATFSNVQMYSGVLSQGQIAQLVPEPATATLSLLALAGLAARRRRK
ncbi:MAG: PEP-CTERM sorting domain-containing protein [Akkermansia sp.]|nr:PEP-CTERM sorting domain-containing protein [Akkermansia sp.]